MDLFLKAKKNGLWTLQAGIFSDNIASIKLQQNTGFRMIGYREKIGRLNDMWCDTVLMEKRSILIGI
jgi:L-amino acid N-acyltransferase YncA